MESLSCPFLLLLRRTIEEGVTDVMVEAAEPDLEILEGVEVSLEGDG
jgi:hypothetical protein